MFQKSNKYNLIIPVMFTGIILFCISADLYGQINRVWSNRFNGSANSFDIVNSVIPDDSGNVFVYGTAFNSSTLTDLTVVKYNSSGNLIFSKSYNYGIDSYDQLRNISKDKIGNSYLCGLTSQGTDENKLLVVKLDVNCDEVWHYIYSKSGYSNFIGKDIKEINGEIFVLANGTFSNGKRAEFLLKYNSQGLLLNEQILNVENAIGMESLNLVALPNGNIVSSSTVNFSSAISKLYVVIYSSSLQIKNTHKVIESTGLERFIKLIKNNSGKIYFTGTKITQLNDVDFQFGCLDVNFSGEVSTDWIRNFNGSGNHFDFPFDICTDNEDNLLITGSSRNGSVLGTEDAVILKYSSTGNFIWQRVYNSLSNGIDQGMSIATDNFSNVYIGGASDIGNIKLAFLILKYSNSGNLLFEDKYHIAENPEDFVYSVFVDDNNDFYVTGISFNPGTDYDFATLKYSSSSNVSNDLNILKEFKLYQNYPNPFNPYTNIEFNLNKPGFVNLKIYDLNGKEISELLNQFKPSGNYKLNFNSESLTSGMYFYKLNVNGLSDTKKMIIIK
ncbi:MAG TPA: T9SS type A sorting domain-containing protein [Ignavibacteria bacterium]|nr:T9SS type A sorting domain-containing protein [Ignavibacteria bacterium]